MRQSVLDGVDANGYSVIWRFWKAGSLGLFAAFVACAVDIAISMRRQTGR